MTLDDKRKVIEVLLCAGDIESPSVNMIAFILLDDDPDRHAMTMQSIRRRERVGRERTEDMTYCSTAIEAAYRLIESSPTLHREWFGAP